MSKTFFDRATFNKGASKINKDDMKEILEKSDEILEKSKGPLSKFIEEIKLLCGLVKDYFTGTYTKIPWTSISMIVFTLLYILNPFDLIPDFLPIVGLIDDASCLALCLASIRHDLTAYKEWREKG